MTCKDLLSVFAQLKVVFSTGVFRLACARIVDRVILPWMSPSFPQGRLDLYSTLMHDDTCGRLARIIVTELDMVLALLCVFTRDPRESVSV